MSSVDVWRSVREREGVTRANRLRLQPAQLKRLLGDSGVRAELQSARLASLLPPVGTEVFRRFAPAEKQVEETDLTKPAPPLVAGKPLPFFYGDPPPELLNTPLEELDPFYRSQKTFIVLSRGNIIHRFNGESACYLLSPLNPVRTVAIRILLHPLFRWFMMATILTNCVLMATANTAPWRRTAEYVFVAVYTWEVLVKVAARGFCVGRFAFLRDPWNWLDVLVVSTAFLTEFFDLRKAAVVIIPRAMKMISVLPGVREAASALLRSVKRMADVIILAAFVLSVLAVIGLELFMGDLTQSCIAKLHINLTEVGFDDYHYDENATDSFNFIEFISSPENQYRLPGESDALRCGNSSSAGRCPEGFICMRMGQNPNYGYTSFDWFGSSLLSLFRLMMQDNWENLLQLVMQTAGKRLTIVFALFIFPSCFCLLSLLLAVVAMATAKRDQARVAEAQRDEEEFAQILEVMRRRRREEGEEEEEEEPSEKQDLAPQKKNSSAGVKSHERASLRCACCGCWRRLRRRLRAFVTNPFFDLGVVICLILNHIFICMEHYPLTVEFEHRLSIASLVFTAIFTAELLLRILATDPRAYFQVGWNIYDSVLVALSLLELVLADVEGLSVVRFIPAMRMLRLARWWPTLHMLMRMIWTSVRVLGNLVLLLIVVVFVSAVIGVQMFGADYGYCACRIAADCHLPRWHMHDFFHAVLVVFRVLCGEWIETLWDCMEVSGQATCLIYFITVVLFGHLLVLTLFISLLLTSLTGDNVAPKEKAENNLHIAINQIKRGLARTRTWVLEHICTLFGPKNHINPDHKVVRDSDKGNKEYLGLTLVTSDQSAPEAVPIAEAEIEFKTPAKHQQDEENTPEDCCCCNSCFCCRPARDEDASRGTARAWSTFRRACLTVVKHKYFEIFIIFIIVLSSAVLVFEEVHPQQQRRVLQMVLDKADHVFCYLFLLEMLLKWNAYGFRKYFTCPWCWLDFVILAVSLMASTLGMLGYSELGAGLSLRTLRALRPLRALSRFKGVRAVMKTLVLALPSMFDALLVLLFVWCIFSVMGVTLFAGKFLHCANETSGERFSAHAVNNKTECVFLIMQNYTEVRWKNMPSNFDNVAAGFLSLLQVATFNGWWSIMNSAVDSTMVESQPELESSLYSYLYFICFIIVGCFFSFNLFVRNFVDTLASLRHKFGGRHVFMTEEQQKCSRAIKTKFSRNPQKTVPRPQNKIQALLFDLVTRPAFEVVMVVLICLNMVTMMVQTYIQTAEMDVVLHWFFFAFLVIFVAEFLLKIIALRQHYFYNCLNVLDFVVIISYILGTFFNDLLLAMFYIPTNLFSLLRLARISRVLHLIPCARRIRRLILAFMMSLPALFNICLLLFLLMFTFSIFGMLSFGHVKRSLFDVLNFETFVNSMMSMFTLTLMAGWESVLLPILATPPDCDPNIENPGSSVTGDCGSPTVGIIFFASYTGLSLLLVFLLYIAVLLQIFDGKRLSDENLQMFYGTWRKFDPDASQVIQHSQLSDFCDALQDPLRIPKPNTIKLKRMDLPLLPGDHVHCVDILLAVNAQVFGDVGETGALKASLEEKFTTDKQKPAAEEEEGGGGGGGVDGDGDPESVQEVIPEGQ